MSRYYYRENFFNTSTKPIEIFNEQNTAVYQMALYYQSTVQKVRGILDHLKHNFKITDNQIIYSSEREKAYKSLVSSKWHIYKNEKIIGELRTVLSLRSKLVFKDQRGETLTFQAGFFSKSVKVYDGKKQLVMTTSSERFKIASRHDLHILESTHHDMLLILLFQVFYEYQEARRRAASSAST
ncbi:hypothetical protein WER83_03555 [Staphylococcus felis]|uniref:tubby C-terminal domain-like protein n=1 Tax=Staphylococcus felis TaxID=46127 RepID=UPI003966B047